VLKFVVLCSTAAVVWKHFTGVC